MALTTFKKGLALEVYSYAGVEYKVPEVHLLSFSDPLLAEYYGRTAYDSFDKSENELVRNLNTGIGFNADNVISNTLSESTKKEDSKLLMDLSHVYFHASVLEHINLSFFIKGISRGVLQELARHRLASPTVRSTRYTLSNVVNAFVASIVLDGMNAYNTFYVLLEGGSKMLVTNGVYNNCVLRGMFEKLREQYILLGKDKFIDYALTKDMKSTYMNYDNSKDLYNKLNEKTKKNVGDYFKHCIDENLSVDLGYTINLRSLKNFFELRLNGAAWFQIQMLANEMFKTLPDNLRKLVDNPAKNTLGNRSAMLDKIVEKGEWEC